MFGIFLSFKNTIIQGLVIPRIPALEFNQDYDENTFVQATQRYPDRPFIALCPYPFLP